MDTVKEDIYLIDFQNILILLFIAVLILSIFLGLDEKDKMQGKKGYFTSKQSKSLILLNKAVAVIILFGFLYATFIAEDIAKKNNENLYTYKLQKLASILSVIAGIIVLYSVILSSNETSFSEFENIEL